MLLSNEIDENSLVVSMKDDGFGFSSAMEQDK
jgi:hypothetical protein